MGLFSKVEELVAKVQFMWESLGKSQSITNSIITILGFFDHRLSTLETAMRPIQVRKEKKFPSFLHTILPHSFILRFLLGFFWGCNAKKTEEG
jgi:hypothetical protein